MRPKRPNKAFVGTFSKGVTPSEGLMWMLLSRFWRAGEEEGMRLRMCVRMAVRVDEGSGTGAILTTGTDCTEDLMSSKAREQ